MQALQQGRLNVGIVRGPVDAPGLSSSTIHSEPFIVALPDDHRLAGRKRIPLAALANDSFIMFPHRLGGHFYEQVIGLCQQAGFTPKVSQEAIQVHVAVGLVSARIGVALVPASLVLLPMAGVVFRPLVGNGAKAEIAIARRANDDSLVVRAFSAVAAEVISGGVAGIGRFRQD